MPINLIIILFGLLVASLMMVFIFWNIKNHQKFPNLSACIGEEGHGQALAKCE